MWDDVAGKASHDNRDKYVVLQVVLTEKFLGTGSGTKSLTNFRLKSINRLQKAINCILFLLHLLDQKDSLGEIRFRQQWYLKE